MFVTHLGHACVLVSMAGRTILIDPGNFSDAWHHLDAVDAVLITHQHADHVDAEPLRELLARLDGVPVYGEAQALATWPMAGAMVVGSAPFAVGDVQVQPLVGDHACIHADIPIVGNAGYVLSAPGEPTFFHPGDSLAQTPSGIDVLALPVHGPWAAMGDHVDFVRAVGARHAFGIHERLLSERGWFLAIHRYHDMSDTEVHDLRHGQAWEVPS